MEKPDRHTLTRRGALGAALALLVPASAAAQPLGRRQGRISGDVLYRERMLLPKNAVVEVSLVDVSLADAPSRTIARTRIRGQNGSPIPFRLTFDRSKISRRRTYALQARITMGDQLLFINMTRDVIVPRARNRMDILVRRASV